MAILTAYLGLGTNLGERHKNLENAARLLFRTSLEEAVRLRPLRSSSVYETAPWGHTAQPDFLNCVLEVETDLPPDQLLEHTQGVEREMGREWGIRFGPRIIDVDILFHGSQTIFETDLQVPHLRLHQRAFALVPLAELAPNLTHPVLGATVEEMAGKADGKDGVRLWGPPLGFPPADGSEPQA